MDDRAALRGDAGERAVVRELSALDVSLYTSFHGIFAPSRDGTTQIDHIVVSPFGIFVVETKNYGGLIFGKADQKNWMQCLGPKKTRFPNPIRQNQGHILSLAAYLSLPQASFHNFVVFADANCHFVRPEEQEKPTILLVHQLRGRIAEFTDELLSPSDIAQAISTLTELRDDPITTPEAHALALIERHGLPQKQPPPLPEGPRVRSSTPMALRLIPPLVLMALCLAVAIFGGLWLKDHLIFTVKQTMVPMPWTKATPTPVPIQQVRVEPTPPTIETNLPQPAPEPPVAISTNVVRPIVVTPATNAVSNVPQVRARHAEVLPDDGSERFRVVPLNGAAMTNQ